MLFPRRLSYAIRCLPCFSLLPDYTLDGYGRQRLQRVAIYQMNTALLCYATPLIIFFAAICGVAVRRGA